KEIATFRDMAGPLAFSHDGTFLLGATVDGVNVIELATLQVKRSVGKHAKRLRALALSHDNRWLATAVGDNDVRLWDFTKGELKATWLGHRDEVACLAFSRDDKMLISGGWD